MTKRITKADLAEDNMNLLRQIASFERKEEDKNKHIQLRDVKIKMLTDKILGLERLLSQHKEIAAVLAAHFHFMSKDDAETNITVLRKFYEEIGGNMDKLGDAPVVAMTNGYSLVAPLLFRVSLMICNEADKPKE